MVNELFIYERTHFAPLRRNLPTKVSFSVSLFSVHCIFLVATFQCMIILQVASFQCTCSAKSFGIFSQSVSLTQYVFFFTCLSVCLPACSS